MIFATNVEAVPPSHAGEDLIVTTTILDG
jgi:hypothetical protein